jgi:adenine-specific DNA-methyltransferase
MKDLKDYLYYHEDNPSIDIYLGDCLDIMPLLPKVDLVVTDPPYLVDWQSNRREIKHELIQNDDSQDWLKPAFKAIYERMNDDSLCVSFYGWPEMDKFAIAWKEAGFKLKSHFVFIKNNIGLGWFTRGQHEQACLLAKGSPQKPLQAPSDVIQAWDGTGNEYHPTQKPVASIKSVIIPYACNGYLILDPFLGSGTTLVACKELKRNGIGIEINEKYCEIAKKRLQNTQVPFL